MLIFEAIAVVVVLCVLLGLLVWLGSQSLAWVPRGHARNVMRLRELWFSSTASGRYLWPPSVFHRTLGPGLHLIIPGVQSAGAPIDLREQVDLLTSPPITTSDKQEVTIETLVSFRVTSPQAAVDCGDQKHAVEQLVSAVLVAACGKGDLAQMLVSRDQLGAQLREALESSSSELGICVTLVKVQSIAPEPMTASAAQMRPHPPVRPDPRRPGAS